MTPTRTTLEAARALIADEKAWCHGWGDGKRRCAVHAIHAACSRSTGPSFYRALAALRVQIGPVLLPEFNDTHTHAEVLAVFDAAIEASPS